MEQRSDKTFPALAGVALALVCALTLVGCAAPEEPEVEPKPLTTEQVAEETPTAKPETTPGPEPEPIALPASCEAMNPALYAELSQYAANFPADVAPALPEAPTNGIAGFYMDQMGPQAKETTARAIQSNSCSFMFAGSTDVVEQGVSELPTDAAEAFRGALKADGGFAESQLNGATKFSYATDPSQGQQLFTTYVFVGDGADSSVLLAFLGRMDSSPYEQPAVDAVIALNPSLGSEEQ